PHLGLRMEGEQHLRAVVRQHRGRRGFVSVLGAYLRLPGPLVNASVLSHLPWHPLEAVAPVATVVLLGLAAALTALGLYGLRRRDLSTG
ncbi:hypothetical protein AB0M50_56565, partial [Nonomuraea fuscirosea]